MKVQGRATFEVAPALRHLVKLIENSTNHKDFLVDLSDCTGMDSTFMGILAMLALKIKACKKLAFIVNASVENKKLLNGLGLQKLYEYRDVELEDLEEWSPLDTQAIKANNAEVVLEAHKTLVKTDIANEPKFRNVINMVEKEINDQKDK